MGATATCEELDEMIERPEELRRRLHMPED
jgi:hypothetical protein